MNINVPEKVDYIIDKLKENGFEAYAVGGCVRDSILGRVPGDWDITTSASPYQVKEIFHRTIDTGIQHGTVTVMLDKEGFEVTTYRLDGEYEDCRHPKQVEFTKSLEEDLKRRDFTINAMAYNHEDGMVDLFEGLMDINRKRIRCVGNAIDRFEEDALRILRAVRFSAQIDFEIEEDTKKAIIQKVENLKSISSERIREELNKLLLSKYPEKLQIAYETGITKIVLPEFNQLKDHKITHQNQESNYGDYALRVLKGISRLGNEEQELFGSKDRTKAKRLLSSKEKICLSYATILQPITETTQGEECTKEAERAKKVLQRLKFDNETIGCVTKLVKYRNVDIKEDDISVRQAIYRMGNDLMDLWFLYQKVLLIGKIEQISIDNKENNSCHNEISDKQRHLEVLYKKYVRIQQDKECVCLKDLKINGKDLMALGFHPGVGIGNTLDRLLQHVLIRPEDNEQEVLKSLAVSLIDLI